MRLDFNIESFQYYKGRSWCIWKQLIIVTRNRNACYNQVDNGPRLDVSLGEPLLVPTVPNNIETRVMIFE